MVIFIINRKNYAVVFFKDIWFTKEKKKKY